MGYVVLRRRTRLEVGDLTMDTKEAIAMAYESLVDAGHNQRSAMMLKLSSLIDDEGGRKELDNSLELSLIFKGGQTTVSDQHGRLVEGIKHAQLVHDQSGRAVIQLTFER